MGDEAPVEAGAFGLAPRVMVLALAVALALSAIACGGNKHVTAPAPVAQPPATDSPAGAVRRLEWAWQRRDSIRTADVLAGEFEFVFALADSAGNITRAQPLDREGMLCATGSLFLGGGSQPPASSVVLHLDPVLTALPDSRIGKNPRWHKEILSGVDLQVELENGSAFDVTGFARFFVVRGDSAVIPPDLAARGAVADSTRWFIDRWNDETNSGSTRVRPARAEPAHPITWGQILALYRCEPLPASIAAR